MAVKDPPVITRFGAKACCSSINVRPEKGLALFIENQKFIDEFQLLLQEELLLDTCLNSVQE